MKTDMGTGKADLLIDEAIALIGDTPGYAPVAAALGEMHRSRHLRYNARLKDRGTTSWHGFIAIGPEALESGIVGLAETLVHEYHHCTQHLLTKPASFWQGVFTRTPVWRRLERPAYYAAWEFLRVLEERALAQGNRDLALTARREQMVVAAAFQTFYGDPLVSSDGTGNTTG